MAKAATVLIADGDPSVIRLLKTVLKNAGHRVVLAEYPEQILEKVGDENVDLALVDFGLLGGRGLDVARRIAADFPDTEIAMLSNFGAPRSGIAAKEAGIHRTLLKPFDDLAAVGRTIRELLGEDPTGLSSGPTYAPPKLEEEQTVRVILADTVAEDRDELAAALEDLGCEVITATCGQEALLRIRSGSHEVLVVGYDMGDMTADDILLRAKRVDEDIAVIVTAKEPTLRMTTNLLKKGAAAFVEKPLIDAESTAAAIFRQGALTLEQRAQRAAEEAAAEAAKKAGEAEKGDGEAEEDRGDERGDDDEGGGDAGREELEGPEGADETGGDDEDEPDGESGDDPDDAPGEEPDEASEEEPDDDGSEDEKR